MRNKPTLLETIISKTTGSFLNYFLKQHRQGKYIELLHAIIKKQDAKSLDKQFGKSNLPFLKNYLQKELLNAMAKYYVNADNATSKQYEISKASTLNTLELYYEYALELNSLKKWFIKEEDIDQLLQVQRLLIAHHSKFINKEDVAIIDILIFDLKKYEKEYNILNQLKILYIQVLKELQLDRQNISLEKIKTFKETLKNVDIKKIETHITSTKQYYFAVQLMIVLASQDFKKGTTFGQAYNQLYLSINKNKVKLDFLQMQLYTFNCLFGNRDFDKAATLLQVIYKTKTTDKETEANKFFIYNNQLLRYLASTKNYTTLSSSLKKIKKNYNVHIQLINAELITTLFTNCIIANFVLNKLDDAIFWYKKITLTNRKHIRHDAYITIRVIIVLAYYLQKDVINQKIILDKFTRESKQETNTFIFEKAIFTFIHKMLYFPNQKKHLAVLIEKLEQLKNNKPEQNVMRYFGYLNFFKALDAKILYKDYQG